MSSDIWNPWHGCRKYSEGCDHCYMYYLDNERGKSGGEIYKVKTNSDSYCKSKVYPALLFSFKMEVWSDELSDWDTTPADKCVSQPPFVAHFSYSNCTIKLVNSSTATLDYMRKVRTVFCPDFLAQS